MVAEPTTPATTLATTRASTHASTLSEVLHGWAAVQPEQTLLIAPETARVLSYGGLAAFSRRFASLLARHAVAPGDHVAMFLHNGLAASAVFLATMINARVIAPLNLLAQPSQLRYVLQHCECRLLVTSADHRARIDEACVGIERTFDVLEIDPDSLDWIEDGLQEQAHEHGHEHEHAPRPDAVALLMYTSGTTGQPKGAMLSHHNVLAAASNVARWHALGTADRVLSALPLYHINGQVIATLSPFVSGGSIVAPRRFSVGGWWDQAREHGCTWLNMVPTIIAYLLNATETPESAALARSACAKVRFGRSASAPLPPEHHRAFEERCGFPVIEAMGMTESASVVFCNPMPPALRKLGSPGIPVGVEALVMDPSGQPVDDGVQGEIWFRGPNVMRGYFKSPEQTAAALAPDGWMRTGDLGHRDADGFFFITGRLKELIIKGGENIAPREIDEVLLAHPAVLEAAAVGFPDVNYGQDILACVVLRDAMSCSEAELRRWCEQHLGRYKTPRVLRFVQALPKGPSGKVQRLKMLETEPGLQGAPQGKHV